MRIDLNSPVEVLKISLPEKDYPACDLTLFNLSQAEVNSVEVTLTLTDEKGEIIQRALYRGRDISLPSRKTFAMPVPVGDDVKPAKCEAIIEKVWFNGGNVWRREKSSLIDVDVTPLESSKPLEELQAVAGAGAVMFPREDDNVWVCVCGRVNPKSAPRCIRCLKDKKLVLTSYSRENVERQAKVREEQLSEESRKAQEASAALREKEETEKKRRKKHTIIATVAAACAVVAASLCLLYVKFFIPYRNYSSACAMLENGEFESAYAAFDQMGGYRDSASKAGEARYKMACSIITSGDMSRLEEARNITASFTGNEAFPDAQEMTNQADYLKADSIMESDPESAEQLFRNLAAYRDSDAKSTRCVFLRGKSLMNAGSYFEAKSLFDTIPDYVSGSDSALEMSQECTYIMGKNAFDEGSTDEAIRLLSSISSYRDSTLLLHKAYYTKAEEYRKNQQYQEAGECYLSAGDYEDAPSMAQGCFYMLGEKQLKDGEYIKAEASLSHVKDYEDGDEKWQEACWKAAKKAMADTEYSLALSYFSKLPDDYLTCAEEKNKCIYLPGKAAMEKGSYSVAMGYFSQIMTYSDSAELFSTCQLEYAKQLTTAGKYDEAISLLTGRTDKAAASQLEKTMYAQGKYLLETKQYQEAATVFEALGSYEDSEALLTEARYGAACDLIASGDYLGAEMLLETTPGYKDTDDKLKECSYMAAVDLSSQGKSEEAARLFTKAIPYSDSAERASTLYYAMAGEAANRQDIVASARYYAYAGDYQDAPEQAAQLFDACYMDSQAKISDMIENGSYAEAVDALNQLDLDEIPEKYAGFITLWADANYFAGEKCLNDGDTESAVKYFEAVSDDPRAKSRLDSASLVMIGDWISRTGKQLSFGADGKCSIEGTETTYTISGSSIRLGGDTSVSFRINSFTENEAVIRDLRNGKSVTLALTRSVPRNNQPPRQISIIPTTPVTPPQSSSRPLATLPPLEEDAGFVVDE